MALLADLAPAAAWTCAHTCMCTAVPDLNISTSPQGASWFCFFFLGGEGEQRFVHISQLRVSLELTSTPVSMPSWQNLSVNPEITSGAWRRPLLQQKHVLDFLLSRSPLLPTVLHLWASHVAA